MVGCCYFASLESDPCTHHEAFFFIAKKHQESLCAISFHRTLKTPWQLDQGAPVISALHCWDCASSSGWREGRWACSLEGMLVGAACSDAQPSSDGCARPPWPKGCIPDIQPWSRPWGMDDASLGALRLRTGGVRFVVALEAKHGIGYETKRMNMYATK